MHSQVQSLKRKRPDSGFGPEPFFWPLGDLSSR